jgi:GNAT superfamily N-acetyltransferase
VRVFRVPWEGRNEDKADDTVWAVACLCARAGFRQQGVSRALASAAVAFARERGARAIEAYPILPEKVIAEERTSGLRACSPAPASSRSAARHCGVSRCGWTSEDLLRRQQ